MPTTAQRAAAYQLASTPAGKFFDDHTIRFLFNTTIEEPAVDVALEAILADALEATKTTGAWESWPSGESKILDPDAVRSAVADAFQQRHTPHVVAARELLDRHDTHTLCHGVPFAQCPVGYIPLDKVVEEVCATKPWLWTADWDAIQPEFGRTCGEVYERRMYELRDRLQEELDDHLNDTFPGTLLRLARLLNELRPERRVKVWCAAHQPVAINMDGEVTIETGVLKIRDTDPAQVCEFGVRWTGDSREVVVVPDNLRIILEPLVPLRDALQDQKVLVALEDWARAIDVGDLDIEAAQRESLWKQVSTVLHTYGQQAGPEPGEYTYEDGKRVRFTAPTFGWLTRTFDNTTNPKPVPGPTIEVDMSISPFTITVVTPDP